MIYQRKRPSRMFQNTSRRIHNWNNTSNWYISISKSFQVFSLNFNFELCSIFFKLCRRMTRSATNCCSSEWGLNQRPLASGEGPEVDEENANWQKYNDGLSNYCQVRLQTMTYNWFLLHFCLHRIHRMTFVIFLRLFKRYGNKVSWIKNKTC